MPSEEPKLMAYQPLLYLMPVLATFPTKPSFSAVCATRIDSKVAFFCGVTVKKLQGFAQERTPIKELVYPC